MTEVKQVELALQLDEWGHRLLRDKGSFQKRWTLYFHMQDLLQSDVISTCCLDAHTLFKSQ